MTDHPNDPLFGKTDLENPKPIWMTFWFLLIEYTILWVLKFDQIMASAEWSFILLLAFTGSLAMLIMCTEKIRFVKDRLSMLLELLIIAACLIVFFSFQYHFLQTLDPRSFDGLKGNIVDYLFNSTMVFFFNPIMAAKTSIAQILMLINIFSSFIFGVFILQNIWEFRNEEKNKDK